MTGKTETRPAISSARAEYLAASNGEHEPPSSRRRWSRLPWGSDLLGLTAPLRDNPRPSAVHAAATDALARPDTLQYDGANWNRSLPAAFDRLSRFGHRCGSQRNQWTNWKIPMTLPRFCPRVGWGRSRFATDSPRRNFDNPETALKVRPSNEHRRIVLYNYPRSLYWLD